MEHSEDSAYAERITFQRLLDDAFPHGAMCATLEYDGSRLRGTRLLGSAGRLFCSDARRRANSESWEHEILIDPRKSEKGESRPTRVWVTAVTRNPAVTDLWEADVVDVPGGERRLLRLNANPPAHLRPSRRTRTAVTRVHEATLFPLGLDGPSDRRPGAA